MNAKFGALLVTAKKLLRGDSERGNPLPRVKRLLRLGMVLLRPLVLQIRNTQ